MNVEIKPGECKEPLDDSHYIIQPENGYRFGADAVALYRFALPFVKSNGKIFDLCSGCGVIALLLAIGTGCAACGAELDAELCDMSNRSAVMNGLTNVKFINADIRSLEMHNEFDTVVCNPPFFKAGSVPRKIAPQANSEIFVTFRDIAEISSKLLKSNGTFCLVHTSTRLDEILCCCHGAGLMPKSLEFINNGKAFLLRAVKGGKQGLTVKGIRN